MPFDPQNKVIQLCAEGMGLELMGRKDEAHRLFQKAWDISSNNFEAFTAAHYLARNQQDPKENLKWNLEALNRASEVYEQEIQSHYPSLYLNVARAYENLNHLSEAAHYYRMAAEKTNDLSPGPYGDMIRSGISQGLNRTHQSGYTHKGIDELIEQWCERRDLKALAFVLPAYISNLGAEADISRLVSALSYLSATRSLDAKEQEKLDGIIRELSTGK
jgi:tetratricopeptide (TPR) repeat protein